MEFKSVLIGFAIGIIITVFVYIWQVFKRKGEAKKHRKEIDKLRDMLSDRMDVESEGIKILKEENENLKKENENLRITNASFLQKPGRNEVAKLHVYQEAVDKLTISSPGFAAAWQSAIKESEQVFDDIKEGKKPFWKKVFPNQEVNKIEVSPEEQ